MGYIAIIVLIIAASAAAFGGAAMAGFIVLTAGGIMFLCIAAFLMFLSNGLTGRPLGRGSEPVMILVLLGFGALLLYLGIANAPFEINFVGK
jgi:hypothetical protein